MAPCCLPLRAKCSHTFRYAPRFVLTEDTLTPFFNGPEAGRGNLQQPLDALLDRLREELPDTYAHSERVRDLVRDMLTRYELPDLQKSQILTAAILHDIGKLNLPTSVLHKSGRLTLEEYQQVQQHVIGAAEYMKDIPDAADIERIIRYHHENFNGFGYPDGLKGEAIPLGSRIIHVAEAYDAMVNPTREAKPSYSPARALSELREYAGRMYDPKAVEIVADVISTKGEGAV